MGLLKWAIIFRFYNPDSRYPNLYKRVRFNKVQSSRRQERLNYKSLHQLHQRQSTEYYCRTIRRTKHVPTAVHFQMHSHLLMSWRPDVLAAFEFIWHFNERIMAVEVVAKQRRDSFADNGQVAYYMYEDLPYPASRHGPPIPPSILVPTSMSLPSKTLTGSLTFAGCTWIF